MLLSILSKFVATLLVVILTITAVLVVISQTLLQSNYVDNQLNHANAYPRLSAALSKQISKESETPDPQLAAKLQTVLTPEVLRQKVQVFLAQLQAYFNGTGPAPTIDLTDLTAKAQAAGIPIESDGDDNPFSKPITLEGAEDVQKAGKSFKQAKTTALIVMVVLLAALILICRRRHRYVALPGVLISLGITLGLIALVLIAVPGLAADKIKADNDMIPIVRDVVMAVASDIGKRLGIIAVLSLAVGIVVRVLLARAAKPQPQPLASPVPSRPRRR